MLLMLLWWTSLLRKKASVTKGAAAADTDVTAGQAAEVPVLQYMKTMVKDDHNAGEIGICEHVVQTRPVMEISRMGRSVVGQTYWRSPSQDVPSTARSQNVAWRRVGDILRQANEDPTEITILDLRQRLCTYDLASDAEIDEAMDNSLKLVQGNSGLPCKSKPMGRSWCGCSIQCVANS